MFFMKRAIGLADVAPQEELGGEVLRLFLVAQQPLDFGGTQHLGIAPRPWPRVDLQANVIATHLVECHQQYKSKIVFCKTKPTFSKPSSMQSF
jgi:hypothetical protein